MFYYTMGGHGSLGFKVENLGDLFSFNFFSFHFTQKSSKNFLDCPLPISNNVMDVLFPAVCKFNKCNFRTQISLIKLPKTFLTLQKFQNLSRAAPIKVFLWPGNFYLLCPFHVEPGLKFSVISPDNIVTGCGG